jgi:hypothetical protein
LVLKIWISLTTPMSLLFLLEKKNLTDYANIPLFSIFMSLWTATLFKNAIYFVNSHNVLRDMPDWSAMLSLWFGVFSKMKSFLIFTFFFLYSPIWYSVQSLNYKYNMYQNLYVDCRQLCIIRSGENGYHYNLQMHVYSYKKVGDIAFCGKNV